MIKEIFKNMALILTALLCVSVMFTAMLLPLYFNMPDMPKFLPWVIYPLALVIAAATPYLQKLYK